MKRRRVKITGLGFVTPAGIGKEAFHRGILEPVSRVQAIKRFAPDAGSFVGAEVKDFRLERLLPDVSGKRMPRHTQFAVAAAKLALEDAGLTFLDLRKSQPAVVVGASLMDFGAINKGVDLIVRKGPLSGLPTSVFTASVSSIGGAISELIGEVTRSLAVQSACCAGLDAIGQGAQLVAAGEVDVAVCGGTESPMYFHPMLELRLAGLAPGNPENPERQCRPFDRWRTTGAIGEGACMLVLEPEESPRPGYAFVDGYAFAADPPGRTGVGLEEAMELALANAQTRPREIEYLSAWGPGHRIIDAAESRAVQNVFRQYLGTLPVSSIKGAVGNPLGAGGAMQVGCAALGLTRGFVPPTVNWEHPDPECPLCLSAQPRWIDHASALVNSHGLSGSNACIVLRR
jgi:3-oxoacyl-(acyl-carrier-protein) synthase